MSSFHVNQSSTNAYFDLGSLIQKDGKVDLKASARALGDELSQFKLEKGTDFYEDMGLSQAQWNAWTARSDYDGDGTTSMEEMAKSFLKLDMRDGFRFGSVGSKQFNQLKTSLDVDTFADIDTTQLKTMDDIPNKQLNAKHGVMAKEETTQAVQQLLIQQGYLAEGEADGYYGPKTAKAVKKLQQALIDEGHDLCAKGGVNEPDGIVGECTWDAMMKEHPDFKALFDDKTNTSTNPTKTVNPPEQPVTSLDAARVAELKADPDFRKLMADKLLTNGQIAAAAKDNPDPMTWGRDLTINGIYSGVNRDYLKPVLEEIDPDNTYNLNETSIQLLTDALAGDDLFLNPDDFKTEIEVVKKERVNKAHDELLKSKPFAKFILSQAKNGSLTEQNILDYLDGEAGLDMDPSTTERESPFDYLRTQDVNLYGLGNTESSFWNKDSWEKLGDKLFDTIRAKHSNWGIQSSYLTQYDAQAHLDSLDD